MCPATFVPEPRSTCCPRIRANRNHIVIDEYRSVAGLVTIEDVLGTDVGDIEDEHDVEEDSYISCCSSDFHRQGADPCGPPSTTFGFRISLTRN